MEDHNCPKCNKPRATGPECPHCGVIYTKATRTPAPEPQVPPAEPKETAADRFRQLPPEQRQSAIKSVTFLFFAMVLLAYCHLVPDDGAEKRSEVAGLQTKVLKTAEQLRRDRIERGFSAWDGTHIALEKMVKRSMNDQKSFEHVETKYWDAGDHLKISMTFRGANAFGGMVLSSVTATATLDGEVIEIVQ